MLSPSSATIGTNLAEILDDNAVKLVPKSNTLLSELNLALVNNLFNTPTNFHDKDSIPPTLIGASNGSEIVIKGNKTYQHSNHDSFMDNYIEDLSKLVTGYISFARTVANKEINLLKEELQESLTAYKHKEPEDFFNVSFFKLNEVFNTYVASEEIKTYADSNSKFFYENMNISKLLTTEFDLEKYILTGDAEQDTVIIGWFNSIGKEKAISYISDVIPEYMLSTDQLLDYSLINYLLYRNLTEKTDLDLGFPVAGLRSKSSANRDYFGNKLFISLELYGKDIRNGRILSTNSNLSFSYFNKDAISITIYEENLQKLAEAGLGLDVIFGYISSGRGEVDINVSELIERRAEYLSKWSNTRSLYLISLNSSRLDIFKQILRERFESSLNREEKSQDEIEYIGANSNYLIETKKLANAYIDDLQVSDIDDVCKVTLELVAKIRYRFTNAYDILREMEEILKMSDKIEPLEAALYSTIKYVTDYMLSQCDVVTV